VVHTWPQICDFGGRNPTAICEDCTRIANALPDSEGLFVWVPIRQEPKPVVKAEAKPKKAKKQNPFNQLLQQEGLL
jgi:hypothetical protein